MVGPRFKVYLYFIWFLICFACLILSLADSLISADVCNCTNWSAKFKIIIIIHKNSHPFSETVPRAVVASRTAAVAVAASQHGPRTNPRSKTAALAHNRLNLFYGYIQPSTAYRRLHTSIPAKADPPLSTAVTPADNDTPITVIARRGSNAQSLLTPKNKTGSYHLTRSRARHAEDLHRICFVDAGQNR